MTVLWASTPETIWKRIGMIGARSENSLQKVEKELLYAAKIYYQKTRIQRVG